MLYEYIPQKNMKHSGGLAVILISAAVGFFLFPSIFPDMSMRWVFQLSGVACLVALIFVVVRYIERSYIYRIVEDEGRIYLTVTQVSGGGRSRVTVCRLDTANITEALMPRTEELKALESRARRERRKRFDFRCDPSAPVDICLFVTENGEDFFVKLSGDARIFSFFDKGIDRSGKN